MNGSARRQREMRGEIDWLLDSDPAIRWQAMRDLTDASRRRSPPSALAWRAKASAQRFSPARARTARGTALTSPTGCRHSSRCSSCARPASTAPTLPSTSAVARLEAGFRWHESFGAKPFFEGEVEPCINGGALALGAYFGRPSESLARRLVGEQLEDGGWNCDAPKSVRSSYHTTICVLEGLLEYERAAGSVAGDREVQTARRGVPARTRALPAALDRRGRESGVPDVRVPAPVRLRRPPCARLLQGRRCRARPAHGRSLAHRREQAAGRRSMAARCAHDEALAFPFSESVGEPSRWNTLRALRVLRWAAR